MYWEWNVVVRFLFVAGSVKCGIGDYNKGIRR